MSAVLNRLDLPQASIIVRRVEVGGREADLVEILLKTVILPSDARVIASRVGEVAEGGKRLCIVSGRAPIWLYVMVAHELLHRYAALAVYDPKVEGAVIVASHSPEYRVGTVVPLKL